MMLPTQQLPQHQIVTMNEMTYYSNPPPHFDKLKQNGRRGIL